MQYKRQLRLGSEVLCRTSAFGKGSLVQRHFHGVWLQSLGSYQRRSRYSSASFLGKEVATEQTEVSYRERRRRIHLTPPLWEGVSLPKATTRSGQRSGARPTTLSPIHPSSPPANHKLHQLVKPQFERLRPHYRIHATITRSSKRSHLPGEMAFFITV